MKILKNIYLVLLLALVGLLPGCQSTVPVAQNPTVPPELLQLSYLHEIMRYLYRWQLHEADVENILDQKQFVFWVRHVPEELDADDHSQFAEIMLPQLGISVYVKKADYTIEETGTAVKSPNFRIIRIARGNLPQQAPRDCAVVTEDMLAMRDYLYSTRNESEYPDAALLEHLREAVRKEAARENMVDTNLPAGEQLIDAAPLSPVANEEWVYWEAGDKLFYVASDMDLANPVVWKYQTLSIRIFDLVQQVVVSHEEAPGSSFFLTRYQMSRALYNCMVLGERTIIYRNGPTNAVPAVKK
ncbi:MAG TPA: hypothetical protein VMH87_00800 [Pseudomonadales bacterium]|nr:hypothetical protein [Pseudomonadales bacterium]